MGKRFPRGVTNKAFIRGGAMKSLRVAGFLIAAVAALGVAGDVHPLGYPTVEALQSLGRKLERATSGRLSLQMYAAMQLGGEKEAIEQAQIGAIQFARVSVGAL